MENNHIPIELNEQKRIMIYILNSFDKYCNEHSLRYHLVGGTLIGSIRHKGFIPWDDDIDVAMPIDDYKKFVRLSQSTSIADDLFVSTIETNPNHVWAMGKIFAKNTYLVEPNVLKKYQKMQESYGGVYIDVFPEYGLPDDEKKAKLHCKRISDAYEKFKRSSRLVNFNGSIIGTAKKIAYEVAFLPNRIIGMSKYLNDINNLIEMYPYDESKKFSFANGIIKTGCGKDIFEKVDVDEYIKGEFEGGLYNIPIGYDRLLRTQFGDYMILPPESSRKIHQRVVYYR